MKKNIYLAAVAITFGLSSCEDFLDSTDYTHSNTDNFPGTMIDAEKLVTSMYANLNHSTKAAETTFFMTSQLASDDCFGGAFGRGEPTCADHLLKASDNAFANTWSYLYKGVAYANTALEGLQLMADRDLVNDQQSFNQMMGEAYFMRAFYNFQLGEMFENVPLILSTTQDPNSPQVTPDELYAQIGSDLVSAIDLMVNKPYNAYVAAGHATRWAAESLLARVWLFYTGFYQKDSMPMVEGSLSKSQVIDYLNDCIQNSGHDLVGDFRNLWAYTNKYTVNDYAYTKDVIGVDGQPLMWAGNGNKEEVFAVKYMNFCGYSYAGQEGYSNYFVPYFGFQGINGTTEDCFPFGDGNGFGPANPHLWEEWDADDIRRQASILSVDDELADYKKADVTGIREETGYYGKKLLPVLSYESYQRWGVWSNSIFWGADPDFDVANNYGIANWGAHFQDLCLIRFADVLLMHSELTGTADGMNRVRARAGLAPITYSLAALQDERRFELAFEGIRYHDIRRWHIAGQVLESQNGSRMNNSGREVTMNHGRYAERYAATRGFFYLPASEIQLSNGVLKQNAGWDTPDAIFTIWNFE